MKQLFLLTFFSIYALFVTAQGLSTEDRRLLQQKEDSMETHALKIIQGITPTERFNADSVFTKMLVRALKTKHSFNYPFESFQTISKLYAPDSSFRIFTWQLVINESTVRQHGAIQMKTKDGTLKLFPLIDKSDVTLNQADTLANNMGWIGAVYYRMVQTRNDNQNFYTLLGYDENNIRSNRKIIEVLQFTDGEPVFGGRHFSFEEDSVSRPAIGRYILEYKKNAGARLTYDDELKMIIFEHLESETNEPTKKWTFIPDGDYEGFKWKNGRWVHIEKVFDQVTPEGKEPVPNPVKDEEGNTLEERLQNNQRPPGR